MDRYLNPPRGGWPTKQPQPSSRFAGLSRGRTAARGTMNKTETRYAAHLDALQAAGQIVAYWFEPFSLRLSSPPSGQPARYTPDFLVLLPDGLTYVDDVKNARIDDPAAIVRIKAAAERYPLWVFRLVRPDGRSRWHVTEV